MCEHGKYLINCKECTNANARKYYHDNKIKRRKYINDLRSKNRKTLKEAIAKIKNVPCVDCGNKFPSCCMDFDHVLGEKRDDVAAMVRNNLGLETVLAEIAKCEIVCANCHRIRTLTRGYSVRL